MFVKKLPLILFILLLTAGCGSVISETALKDVDRSITVPAVQADPESYIGKTVVWGGRIVTAENMEDVTLIEVLESRLSIMDIPSSEKSRGRFLIEAPGYLDTLTYKHDLEITVAGVIKGVEHKAIGKMNYPYPVLSPLDMEISDPPETYYYDYPFRNRPYYYDPLYDPYYYGPQFPYYYRPGRHYRAP